MRWPGVELPLSAAVLRLDPNAPRTDRAQAIQLRLHTADAELVQQAQAGDRCDP